MKRPLAVSAAVCFLFAWPASSSAQTTGFDPRKPAPVAAAVKSVVQCGNNPTAMEPYDVSVTVKQVLRGKEALEALRAADALVEAPAAGHEYLLARVAIQLTAKVAPGNKSFEVGRPMQWVAMSADGAEYPAVKAAPPKPAITGQLRAGETMDGWVAFQVDQKDKKPMLFFDPASGGGTLRGSVLFFQLF